MLPTIRFSQQQEFHKVTLSSLFNVYIKILYKISLNLLIQDDVKIYTIV